MLDAAEGTPGPWLCHHHRVAGGALDARCCAAAASPDRTADRGLWFTLRLASKPLDIIEAIGAATDDRQFCLGVLARHATLRGRRWSWGRATRRLSASHHTQNIRVLRAT